MMTRSLFSACVSILLLQPVLGWALDETENSPGAQSAPVSAAPAKPIPQFTAPVKSAPASITPAQSAPVPAKPAPAKPAPVLAAPAKPTPVQSAPAQSLSAHSAPTVQQSYNDADNHTIDIEVFVREDCPNCEQAKIFLAKLKNLHPQLTIITRDVRKEPAALELLKRMTQNQREATLDYPAFVVGGQLIIGFSEEEGTASQILDTLANNPRTSQQEIQCVTGTEPDCGLITPALPTQPERAYINLFGHNVPLAQIGLPLFTLAMGLLDGLNHVSTWVLILMISLLAPLKDRALMLTIAGTFVAVQGVSYYILTAAWLHLFLLIEISRVSQFSIAVVAIMSCAFYLNKYMQLGRRLAISSHEVSKPGIYSRIRQIVQAKNLFAALLGTTLLAILVQLGEFSYTSVFPAIYAQVLTMHQPDSIGKYGYLLLYNLAYMLDDLIVLTIGLVTLGDRYAYERKGRSIKLISSLALAGVAVYLLLALYRYI